MYYCKLTSDWNEDTVTWETQPSYYNIRTSSATVPSTTGIWMEWDVTQDVQKFVQKQYPNYGWRIRDEIPWGKVNIPITYFYSKEHGYFKPHLEVVINDHPPNKPATASGLTTVKIGVALCIVHMQSIQKESSFKKPMISLSALKIIKDATFTEICHAR